MQNLYDVLLRNIRACVQEISFQRFQDMKRLVVVAINDEGMNKKLLQNLADVNPDMEVVIITQPRMAEILQSSINEKIHVLEWQGAYTEEVVCYVKSKLPDLELDGFLYFCDQPINLRNHNLLDIAEIFANKPDFYIGCVDFEGSLYEYWNIALYNLGIHIYKDMNRFIELSLETEGYMED